MTIEGEYIPSAWDWVREQVDAYEASGGTEATTFMGTDMPVIVVTTRGAKTGAIRKFALMRVEHDGQYALVASKGGDPHHPGWYHNVVAHPDEVLVQDGVDRFPVEVRELAGDEKAVWWERSVAAYPPYADYQAKTDRPIPVILATRKA
jgi:F420H(2)-dependent quinone reductase